MPEEKQIPKEYREFWSDFLKFKNGILYGREKPELTLHKFADKYFRSIGDDPVIDLNITLALISWGLGSLASIAALNRDANVPIFTGSTDGLVDKITDVKLLRRSFGFLGDCYRHYKETISSDPISSMINDYIMDVSSKKAQFLGVQQHENPIDDSRAGMYVELYSLTENHEFDIVFRKRSFEEYLRKKGFAVEEK